MNTLLEGKARIYAPELQKISKQMGVFYNPAMKMNRDLSILLLNSASNNKLQIADPLAGTGIRGIRFLLELEKSKMESISINDYSGSAVAAIRKNMKLNRIKTGGRIKITAKDANIFMLESTGFDYIDIDPFGYPGKFIDAASQRIARGGLLAVTATDTAALAGSSPSACARKYWAIPLRNDFMHETGLRILIRRVQLSGMQHEKALEPVFSYRDQHYIRAFFTCSKGRSKASGIYRKHGYIACCRGCLNAEQSMTEKCSNCGSRTEIAGPLWLGRLNNARLLGRMLKKAGEHRELLSTIRKETTIGSQWFFNLNRVCSRYRIRNPRGINESIKRLREKGYKAERTHFDSAAIRTDCRAKELAQALRG